MVSIKISAPDTWETKHPLHRSTLNRPEYHTGFSTGSSRKISQQNPAIPNAIFHILLSLR